MGRSGGSSIRESYRVTGLGGFQAFWRLLKVILCLHWLIFLCKAAQLNGMVQRVDIFGNFFAIFAQIGRLLIKNLIALESLENTF